MRRHLWACGAMPAVMAPPDGVWPGRPAGWAMLGLAWGLVVGMASAAAGRAAGRHATARPLALR